VRRRTSGPKEACTAYPRNFFFGGSGGRQLKVNQLSQVHLEKGHQSGAGGGALLFVTPIKECCWGRALSTIYMVDCFLRASLTLCSAVAFIVPF